MDSKPYMRIMLEQMTLIAALDRELTAEQEARRRDVEQLHAQYGQKLENLKATLPGDGKGSTDVPAKPKRSARVHRTGV